MKQTCIVYTYTYDTKFCNKVINSFALSVLLLKVNVHYFSTLLENTYRSTMIKHVGLFWQEKNSVTKIEKYMVADEEFFLKIVI